jgi:hypothetical protein
MMKINGYKGDFDFLDNQEPPAITQDDKASTAIEKPKKKKVYRMRELLFIPIVGANLMIMIY